MEEVDERQIVGNIDKVDADKKYHNIEIDEKYASRFAEFFFKEEMPDYEPVDLESTLISNRMFIRNGQSLQEVLDYLIQSNESIIRALIYEINGFYMMGLYYENISYIKEYIDYAINDILQLIVYKVINNPNINTLDFLQELKEEIKALTGKVDNQLMSKRGQQQGLNILTTSKVMRYFSAYLKHRSRLKEETDIYRVLEKERKQNPALFDSVQEEYRAVKVRLSEEDIKKSAIIITEGKSIYKYEDKLLTVRDFIDIMRNYGGRQCYPDCLQDLKVYFREIYMSKATYRRQQAHKIVKDYIGKVKFAIKNNEVIPEFDRKSQYLFVREKISRGYFREKGLLSDYYGKIEFTNEFYDLLLKIYLFYDVKDSLELIYDVNYILLNKFHSLVDV